VTNPRRGCGPWYVNQESGCREALAARMGFAPNSGRSLTPAQQANLHRYTKKLPNGHGPVTVEDLPGGGIAFLSEVPGRVPGWKAIYRKELDAAGRTTGYTKTTMDPQGRIVDTKIKF
jgi:hypothetical protein